VLLTTAASLLASAAEVLPSVPSRDNKVIHRWSLAGDPRGVAHGSDGTIYVGLAQPQAVIAIDPKNGEIKKRVVLDSAEIASTKELVTLRTNPERTRLFIANGSDESASILSLPGLAVLREITMEGETIRDVVPDPKGRFVYLLGRRVHVYDKNGATELRTLPIEEPMAIAASANGALLAVVFTEDFGNTKATSVAMFDTTTFAEVRRDPLQTTETIEAALFADKDRALMALGREHLFEKTVASRGLNSSDSICLPEGSGPQIATLGIDDNLLLYAERRCSASATFGGSKRSVMPASLYGVNAYAVAHDKNTNLLIVTDRAGFLTLYNVPRVAVAR
jgi:hypothetical protein